MIRIAALAELCLLAWGFQELVLQELASRLGPAATDAFLTWLRWLMA